MAGGEGMSEEDGFRLVAVGSGTQRLSALVGEERPTSARRRRAGTFGSIRARRRCARRCASCSPTTRRRWAARSPRSRAPATLWECAAIVSAPGAAPQILHADATHTPEPLLVTAFVALQDVRREMGPTRFVRGTHTEPGPAAVLADGDALGLADARGGRRRRASRC